MLAFTKYLGGDAISHISCQDVHLNIRTDTIAGHLSLRLHAAFRKNFADDVLKPLPGLWNDCCNSIAQYARLLCFYPEPPV